MRALLDRVIFRAITAEVWAATLLTLWGVWPTDGTPAPIIGGPHFHLGG